MSLGAADFAIIALYFVAMGAMGFAFSRRNRSADVYFKSAGRIPWPVVMFSIYATMFSSITFLSVPAMSYDGDCRWAVITFGIVIVAPVVVKWYLPYFRRLNLTSAYEYLEMRFNPACRTFASAAFVLFMVARSAIVAYLPAVAISAVTGLDVNAAIVAVGAVTILYAAIGGVEAVIWSDFAQSMVLIVSTVLIFAWLVLGTDGGAAGFVSAGMEAGKFRMFDFALDWTEPCFWVVLAGGIVANLASYTSDQSVVQRYMTAKDENGAAKSILVQSVVALANSLVFFALGVALWTFYKTRPDALPAGVKPDAVLPVFIVRELPAGVSGLVVAAIAAATMSTFSANLNSAASAITEDFYKRLLRGRAALRCARVSTVAVGVAATAFALHLANSDVQRIYGEFQRFLGVLTGGLGCLFFMGVFMKKVDGFGAVCGLCANYAVTFGLDLAPVSGKPHILLYGFFGMLAALAIAPAASWIHVKMRTKGGTE